MLAEPTLSDLAAASGLQPRTIRSWIAQGLLPGPLTRGPFARYPADMLQRVLAVRAMREVLGMPIAAIRQELLVASPEQIAAWAARAASLLPEPPPAPPARPAPPDPESALAYLRALRAQGTQPPPAATDPPPSGPLGPVFEQMAAEVLPGLQAKWAAAPPPRSGFEALEHRLSEGGMAPPAARKARAEDWLRIPITPDVELAIRGRLDAEQRARLERCADLIRDILHGRDR
ncbi:MAG: helix-turn-helix domain-containing protein [Acetobacteraceae bacterium]|nr:helix-turn-helix domain-containing protein [Acetobacteraceae bacterium]